MISLSDKGVHALSFFFVMVSITVVNAVWVLSGQMSVSSDWQMLGIVDMIAFAGLSYYGANIKFTPSGTTINTQPGSTQKTS
ncbi:MAG: hypothetical protein ACREBA_00975 [Nitrosotalea sp.]